MATHTKNTETPADDRILRDTKRALIADDEPFVCNLIGNIIKAHFNFEIDKVENGSDAIVMALAREYQIVLIDLVMPNTSGIKAIDAIKSMKPEIPIIAMSGRQEAPHAHDGRKTNYDRFLKKPFGIPLLINEINEALNIEKMSNSNSRI